MLKLASEEMRSDRNFILPIVERRGDVLLLASTKSLSDPIWVKTAFRTYPEIIQRVGVVDLGWDFNMRLVRNRAELPKCTDQSILSILQDIHKDNTGGLTELFGTLIESSVGYPNYTLIQRLWRK